MCLFRRLLERMCLQVYVLLFGVGSAAVEGVHTIRALDVNHGSASDTVVAFEAHDDAERYARQLDSPSKKLAGSTPRAPLRWAVQATSGWGHQLEGHYALSGSSR